MNGTNWLKLAGACMAAIGLSLGTVVAAQAEEAAKGPYTMEDGSKVKMKGAEFEDGMWTVDGEPTYRVKKDGTIDFQTYRGFQRYHAECHVCHGPEGMGSTYAPALVDSMKTMSYSDFVSVVASGRVVKLPGGGESVMPALGDNTNVMCYLDGIYNYLKARADGVVPRGRPKSKDSKPKEVGEAENACLSS